jgi:endonuclease-3
MSISYEASIKILDILNEKYGTTQAFLSHNNIFEFLIAVILSAQTKDETVNQVTPRLFAKYKTIKSLKLAKINDVYEIIKNVNYNRTKAKRIIQTAKIIDEKYHGEVPDNMEMLLELPGVGRKVANVILAEKYRMSIGIVVDTHVKRVSKRIGWTNSNNPRVVEKDLMNIWPTKYFIESPKHLILIGRQFCHPKKPDCENCPLNKYCEKRI